MCFRIEGKQLGAGNLEEPTVQAQRTSRQPILHAMVAVQILERERALQRAAMERLRTMGQGPRREDDELEPAPARRPA